jgi:ABC-type dipeptide/oligopeptide/nickel transport system ATPase component
VSRKGKADGKKSQAQINAEKAAEYAAEIDKYEDDKLAKGRVFDPYELLARTDGIQTVDHPVLGTLKFGELTFEDAFEIDKCKTDALKTETIAWLMMRKAYPDLPLIDTVGATVEEGMKLLSKVGLNDAFLFVRSYSQLSDGQKYRYRLAKLIESGAQWWVMDEFCATLDRETAKIVAYNVQKLARKLGRAVIAATTHVDLLEDLAPSVHIHKRFGREVTVDYFPNEPRERAAVCLMR